MKRCGPGPFGFLEWAGPLVVEQVIGLVSDVGLIIWASKYLFS